MLKVQLAEWLLKNASTPRRASEIVGDLIEQNMSEFSFWLATTRILVALTWRWMLGFIVAGACALVVVVPYRLIVHPKWRLPLPQEHEPWVLWALYLSLGAWCFGTNTGLTAARYGIRDCLTWISAALWVTLTICACGAWLPGAPHAIFVVLLLGVATLLLFRVTRRSFLSVLAATASYAASSAFFIMLFRWTSIHDISGTFGNSIFRFVAYITSVGIEAAVLARLRRIPSDTIAS